MIFLAIKLWPWLALAFVIGIVISWITCSREDDKGQNLPGN